MLENSPPTHHTGRKSVCVSLKRFSEGGISGGYIYSAVLMFLDDNILMTQPQLCRLYSTKGPPFISHDTCCLEYDGFTFHTIYAVVAVDGVVCAFMMFFFDHGFDAVYRAIYVNERGSSIYHMTYPSFEHSCCLE